MSQYVRHFLEEPCITYGQSPTTTPAGFSPLFMDTGSLGTPNYQLFVQHGDNGDHANLSGSSKHIGDRYLAFRYNTTGLETVGHLCMFGWDVVNADANHADFEILCRFHSDGHAANPAVGWAAGGTRVGGRCTGLPGAWTGYFADFTGFKPTIRSCTGGLEAILVQGAAVTLPMGGITNMWMRFQVRGTNLKAKLWTGEFTDEPAAWGCTATDSGISAAGAIGWGGLVDIAGGHDCLGMTFLSVGTGTDSAPNPPVTWSDYLAFLALQDAQRCLLFEADPLGQDTVGNPLTARVCGATMAFMSKPMDQPYSSVCYEEIMAKPPKIKRRMNDVLRGRTTLSYGDMEVVNEVSKDDLSGRLDAWYDWNWDGRPIRYLLGHPSWRRVDFKTVFLGAVQNIYRASYGRIGFKLRGPEAAFQNPVTTALIGGSGPNANAVAPIGLSQFFNAEPPVYDAVALTYQVFKPFPSVTNGGMARFAATPPDVRIGGAPQTQATRGITAVNTGTDTITFDANHGGLVGGTLLFDLVNPLPAPLVGNVKYYIKTVPGPNQVTLSATAGGATIDITTATTGATAVIRNVDYDDTTGRITLLVDPQNSRVTVDMIAASAGQGLNASAAAILTAASVPFYTDAYHGAFYSQALGKWTSQQWVIGDALDELSTSTGTSWNFAREGGIYFTQLGIPGATPTWTITSDDIRSWRSGERWVPSNVEPLGYQYNNTVQQGADLVGSLSLSQRILYGLQYSLAGYVPTDSGLDQPSQHLLADNPVPRSTLLMLSADATAEMQRLYQLRRKVRGTWLFNTDAWALAAELGDVVAITYPHDDFNLGKNVVIVGATDDLDTFTSELEVYAQISGQWPIVSSTSPYASEAYY